MKVQSILSTFDDTLRTPKQCRCRVLGNWSLFLVIVSLSVLSATNAVSLHTDDQLILDQFIDNISNIPSYWNRSDLAGACSWKGMACDADGRLLEIVIIAGGLNSTIPVVVSTFPELISLVLANCSLHGTIPPEIFTPKLQKFNVISNALNGTIPPEIVNAANLITLVLESNLLTGSIPSGLEALNLTYFSATRNRLGCPFPTALFNKLSNSPDTIICSFSMNNWDLEAKDGTICNNAFEPPVGNTNCTVYPFSQVRNLKHNTPEFTFSTPTMALEAHGNSFGVFTRFLNGTVYREEYLGLRIYSVDLFNQTKPAASIYVPPEVKLFASYPVSNFTDFKITEPGVVEISTYWPNQRIHTLTLIWVAQPDGTLKFSARILGDDIFAGLPVIGGVSLVAAYESRGRLFDSESTLRCNLPNTVFYAGDSVCRTNLFNATVSPGLTESNELIMTWTHETAQVRFVTVSPFVFEKDGKKSTFFVRRQSLSIAGYGSATAALDALDRDYTLVNPDDQGFNVLIEMLFMNVQRQVLWDPNITLTLLFDTGRMDLLQAPEATEAVNVGVTIGVTIAVVAVVVVIVVTLAVPSIRRKLLPMEAAEHEAKKTTAKSRSMANETKLTRTSSSEQQEGHKETRPPSSQWARTRPTLQP